MSTIPIGLGNNTDGTAFTITQEISGKTQEYRFFYDLTSKKGNLFPVDADGARIAGGASIWIDGNWQGTKIKDGNLTYDVLNGYNGRLKTQLTNQLNNITGAQKRNASVPNWAKQTNNLPQSWLPGQASPSSAKSATATPASPPAGNPIADWFNGLTGNAVPAANAFITAVIDPYKAVTDNGIGNNRWDMKNDKSGNLIYPIDLTKMQDYFKIECYRYQAPYAAAMTKYVKQAKDDFKDFVGGGMRRGTALALAGDALGTIYLPMPQQVRDSNAVRWQDDNLNNLAGAALGYTSKHAMNMLAVTAGGTAVGGLSGIQGLGNLVNKGFFYGQLLNAGSGGTAQAVIGPAVQSMLAGQLGIDVSPETILSRVGGVIQNTNTELLFRGVQTRSFNFSYRMSARSPEEALMIRKIIRYLKQWSAARKVSVNQSGDALGADQPSFFLGTPNVFKLSYNTNNGQRIAGVNNFKQCALTRIATNYTPDNEWNAFEGGMPVSVQIEMEFSELEPLYNTDYSGIQGYNFPSNLVTAESAEVGY